MDSPSVGLFNLFSTSTPESSSALTQPLSGETPFQPPSSVIPGTVFSSNSFSPLCFDSVLRNSDDDNSMAETPVIDRPPSMMRNRSDSAEDISSQATQVFDDDDDDDTDADVSQSPRMPNLVSPPLENSSLPPRSESAMPSESWLHLEDNNTSSVKFPPAKIARMGTSDCLNVRCRRGLNTLHTRSASVMPAPEQLLFSVPTHQVVIRGLTLPVVLSSHGQSETHHEVSVDTARDFITGKIQLPPGYKLLIWDARFFYEYDGGHIVGARRFSIPGIRRELDEIVRNARLNDERYFVLCYCQFSSQRAPTLRDILFAAESDAKLVGRKTVELQTTEESRFEVLIVNGGYDAFFAAHKDLCEPMHYTKELDDLINGKRCRSLYNAELASARVNRTLQTSPGTFLKRSQSMMEMKRRAKISALSENHDGNAVADPYFGISDDEYDDERPSSRGERLTKVSKPSFDDDM